MAWVFLLAAVLLGCLGVVHSVRVLAGLVAGDWPGITTGLRTLLLVVELWAVISLAYAILVTLYP
jgi:hypothetical protein